MTWQASDIVTALASEGDRRPALTNIERDAPTEEIVDALVGLEDAGRVALLRLLSRRHEDQAQQALLVFLEDADPSVRAAAAEALGHRGDPEAAAPLTRAFRAEPDLSVRQTLAAAIGAVGAADAVPDLMASLLQPDDVLRRVSAWSLSELGATEASPLLALVLERETDQATARAIDDAIQRLGASDERATGSPEQDVARAVAHPVRVAILRAATDEFTLQKMVEALGGDVTVGVVAYHVRIMVNAGLLREEASHGPEGGAPRRVYRLAPTAASDLTTAATALTEVASGLGGRPAEGEGGPSS